MVGILLGLIGIDGVDARSTEPAGPDIQLLAHDHAANAHGAEQTLVAGEGQDVDPPGVHSDRQHAGALTTIDDEQRAGLPGNAANGLEILDRSEHVGGMIDHDHPRVRVYRAGDIIRIDIALRIPPDMGDVDASVAFQMRQRTQHGIVLEACRDHMVAALE